MLNFEITYLLTAIVLLLVGIAFAIMAYPGPKHSRKSR